MRKKTVITFLLAGFAFLLVLSNNAVVGDTKFMCDTTSGYGEILGINEYYLDLQCQPGFNFTFEIEPDDTITIEINLENYRIAEDDDGDVEFYIHLAMDRAYLGLQALGSSEEIDVVDADGEIQDIRAESEGRVLVLEVENKGWRSAVFDLSVRPR